jgi:predicted permease
MLNDLRYGLRSFRKRPAFTLTVALTLGLGIGGATAVFTVFQAVLLDALPYPQADRLVRIWELTRDGERFSVSDPTYIDLRGASRSFSGVAAYRELGIGVVMTGEGDPERVAVVHASASMFDVLGVAAAHGRTFGEREDAPGIPNDRVVLSEALWRRRFAARPDTVGRRIELGGLPHVIVGVMPRGFDFPSGADAWVPLAADPRRDRGDKELAVIGRLAPGVGPGEARAELRSIVTQIASDSPATNAGWSVDLAPFREWLVPPRFRTSIWTLAGAVGLLLLLACANVANLLLAEATRRRSEMAIRTALGARRVRLVRQLFTESALLAAAGTGVGLLLAFWAVDVFRSLGAGRIPRLDAIGIDATVLAFSCAMGAASCFLFGLAPTWEAARTELRDAMDEGLRYTRSSRGARDGLVVAEVALALILLVSAGLMAATLMRLSQVDTGFSSAGVFAVPLETPASRLQPDGSGAAAFYSEALDRIRALPGVVAAGATSTNPFRQFGYSNSVTPEERAAEAPPSGLVQAGWRSVTPGFFEALNIPLRAGRLFSRDDRDGSERVIVISENLAARLWPGAPAVGRRIYWGGTTGRTRTVIGVVADIRDVRLDEDAPPLVFVPHAQVDVPGMTIVARTGQDARVIAPAVRAVLREIAPAEPPPTVVPVEASRAQAFAGPRFNFWLFAAFASIALVLAVTGVYAMLAFTVSERRRELALRLVLGAAPRATATLVLRRGLMLVLAGLALGTAAALAGTRMLASLLFGVRPIDPMTFGMAVAALLASAAVACYLPARRAAGIDPVTVLRNN